MPHDEAAYRLRPLQVQVLVTGDHLLTLHQERVSLPAVVAPDLPEGRSADGGGAGRLPGMTSPPITQNA